MVTRGMAMKRTLVTCIAVGAASALYATAWGDEVVVKCQESLPRDDNANIVCGIISNSYSEPARHSSDSAALDRARAHTFRVYTKEEIEGIVAAVYKHTDNVGNRATQELAATKMDLLRAVSDAVGKQLSPEQLQQVKEAVMVDLVDQMRSKFAADIAAEVKAEVAKALRR